VLRTTTYDGRGLVATEQDSLGRTLVYTYDGLGRMTSTVLKGFVDRDGTQCDIRLKELVYDPQGRVARESSGNGVLLVDRTFDMRGRVTAEVFVNTGSLSRRVTYAYDPVGNITSKRVVCVDSCSVPSLEERYEYDSAGRVIRRTVENGSTDLVTATRYDQLGNAVAVTDPRGMADPARPAPEYTTVTGYDVLGRVSSITYPPVVTESKGVAPATESPVVRTGYNTFGEVTDSVDANGNRTVTGYDGVGRRTSIAAPQYTPPSGATVAPIERFTYDAVGNLIGRVDRLGQVWTFQFDSLNRVVRQVAPPATVGGTQATTLTWYDAVGNVVKTVDALGATRTFEYDALNRQRSITEVIRPAGTRTSTELAVSTFDYDILGNLIYSRDPLGNVTTQIFSPLGELLRTTLPASGSEPSSTNYSYDLAGRVVTTTDALGREQRSNVDGAGRVVSVSLAAPAGAGGTVLGTTTYSYDGAGNRLAVMRPEGDSTTFSYDGLNQLRTVREVAGMAPAAWWRLGDGATPTVQDSSGRGAHANAVGPVTVTQGTGALGTATSWLTFSAGGRVDVPAASMRGPTKSISVWFKTSSAGVIAARANGSPGSTPSKATPLIYVGTDGKLYGGTDAANTLSTTAVVNNNTWQRVVLVLTPERQALYLNGTLVKTSARVASDDAWVTAAFIGTGFTAGFPATTGSWMPFVGAIDDVAIFDQPVGASMTGRSLTAQVALPAVASTSFGYDRAGNQTKTVDPKSMTWWTTYNTWNLVQSRIEPWTTSATEAETGRTYTYTYNAAGQLLSELMPGAVRTNNGYDNLGRLVSATGVNAAGARSFSYDLAGRLTAFSHPKGQVVLQYDDRGQLISANGPAGTSQFSYDLDGRMVSRTDAAGTATFGWTPRSELAAVSDPVTGTNINYTYNATQQPASATVSTTTGTSSTRTFEYDPWGRLATDTTRSAARATLLSLSYGYDRNSNLLQRTTAGPTIAAPGTERFAYDQANRLAWWSSTTGAISEYSYDLNGNRTRAGTAVATFDNRNRMKTQGAVTYNWSPRGTLASTVTGGVTTAYSFSAFGELLSVGGVSFTYDALGRIASRTATGAAAVDFSYAGVLSDPSSDGASLIARSPSGKPLSVGAGANRGVVVANLHGDVVGTIGGQGQVLSSRGFDPFGKVTASSGAVPSIGYQGDWTDPVSGLVDMGARWYSPVMGGFVSRDSYSGRLDTPVSLNRYTYANANPLAFSDPTGRYSADSLAHYAEKARQSMASKKPSYPSTLAQRSGGVPKRGSLSGSADSMARQASIAAAAQAKAAQDALISDQLRAMTVNQPTPKPNPAAPVASLPTPSPAQTLPNREGRTSLGSTATPSAEDRALWIYVNYGDSFLLGEAGVNSAILCSRGDTASCLDYGYRREQATVVLAWVDATIRTVGNALTTLTDLGFDPDSCSSFWSSSCAFELAGITPWGKAAKAGRFLKWGDEAADSADLVHDIDKATNTGLLDELAAAGVKHNPSDIVRIAKDGSGRVVFLETGNSRAGLAHIVGQHGDDFARRGISVDQIPDLVTNAASNGRIVGYQGAGTGRPIYEVVFDGSTHRVAVTVGNNGFIVGANPA
jgi:RHS repeat-associated protein